MGAVLRFRLMLRGRLQGKRSQRTCSTSQSPELNYYGGELLRDVVVVDLEMLDALAKGEWGILALPPGENPCDMPMHGPLTFRFGCYLWVELSRQALLGRVSAAIPPCKPFLFFMTPL